MLPNWLYGKSKSKLASILGGGGGTPADYNQVKAQVAQNKLDIEQNTEDITNLSDALDAKAALTQITNPNLLDNPWFTINQRGETSYAAAGNTFDRWRMIGNAVSIEKSNGVITFSTSAAYNNLQQHIELGILKGGKTYTLSILKSDDTIFSKSFVFEESSNYINIYSSIEGSGFYGTYITRSDHVEFVVFDSNSATVTSASFKAVKLEVGSVSTLAMDTAPNYATELLKCQRYYQKFNFSGNGPIAFGFAGSGVSARIAIPLLAPMRITGQIADLTNGYENIVILNNNTEHAVSMLATRVNECYCFLDITSSDLTPNKLCVAKQGTGAFILEISAEL